jgi:hypothetical protein
VLTIGVLMAGAVGSFLMHPERQFSEDALPAGTPAPAE